MHILTTIEQLGIPGNEARIYLTSLKMGEATISDIAKRVNLPRTTVQSLVTGMSKKGLLNSLVMHKRRYWVAENPDKLLIHLREREAALKAIMPELQAMRQIHGGKPTVRLYQGTEEIRKIMDDVLDTKHHITAVLSWVDWIELFGQDFMDDFIERRHKQFLKIHLITPRSDLASSLKKRDQQELRSTRFLPPHYTLNTSNFLYGNKAAVISLNRQQPFGIVIDDPDIVHTMNIFFESLWLQSSEQ